MLNIGTILKLNVLEKLAVEESATCSVTVYVPADAGAAMPLIPPLTASRFKPAGNGPAVNDHAKGPVPPVHARGIEYKYPSVPLGSAVVVITRAALIVIVKSLVFTAPLLSVTLTVKAYGPARVGVPLNTPAAVSPRPFGKLPDNTLQTYTPFPPVADSVWLYPATFAVQAGRVVVVMSSC
jgi:hypothetical protein